MILKKIEGSFPAEGITDQMYASCTVFLSSILGMGEGPSEFGKSVRKNWKLGKVETCLKA